MKNSTWCISKANVFALLIIFGLNSHILSAQQIGVLGNAVYISDNDNTPTTTDHTDFGSQTSRTYSVDNTQTSGNTTLTVSSIALSNTTDFVISSGLADNTITKSQTPEPFTVSLLTAVPGTYTSTVTIASDATNDGADNVWIYTISATVTAPQPEIDITGQGTSITDGDSTPSTSDDTDFGSTDVGTPVVHTFTIQNTGSVSLSVGSITFSGINASEFSVTSSPASSVAAGGNTTFDVTFNPTGSGIRSAVISIVNSDSNENPYTFSLQGTGVLPPPEYTYYYETFDSSNGGWAVITSNNDTWVWTNSFPTNELAEGSFWRNNNFNNYNNNVTIEVQSPVLNFTGIQNLRLSVDVKYKVQDNADGMVIKYSVAGGPWTTLGASGQGTNWYEDNASVFGHDAWNGDGHSASPSFNPHNQFSNARIDLSDAIFAGQNHVRFRVQFRSNGSTTDDGVGFDNFRIEGDPTSVLSDASIAPANITSNLRLWLKLNAGVSVSDGDPLTTVEDQAYDVDLDKEDAFADSSLAPTYRDNGTRNMNYNPVADFDHDNREYMNGKGGFYSQDYFAVFRSDDVVDTQTGSKSPGRQFAIGGRFSSVSFHEDPTGLGLGSTSGRYSNEVISHTIDSYPLSGPQMKILMVVHIRQAQRVLAIMYL